MPACVTPYCDRCPIRDSNAFCNLPHNAQDFFDANAIPMEYPRGAVLFRQGDQASAVFALCSGRVKVSVSSREGRTMILRVIGAGTVLGISAALSGELQETTIEALEPCRVRVLRTAALATLLRRYPETGVEISRVLACDYKAAFAQARRIALPSNPAGRIACLLLDWVKNETASGEPETITMTLTHDELASMAATTRETVTRTISRFRREGLIRTHGVALTLLQPAALAEISAC